jgi:hypothetical protein
VLNRMRDLTLDYVSHALRQELVSLGVDP